MAAQVDIVPPVAPKAKITNGHQPELLTNPNHLSIVDHLREMGFAQYLPLPQLVAVGDQGSGKSALLENITGIPFPRDQVLCTRYATQITHRRGDQLQITVSIIPGPNASPVEKTRLESYRKQLKSAAEFQKMFPKSLDEVNRLMDIRTKNNPDGTKAFTDDVLKIEKCGPEEDQLTIIDVPGIFRATDEGITTNKDRDLVMSMVEGYIQDSQTIILAVLSCTVDVATQEILTLAKQHDPAGERTLGVLTKPDLLKERSAKAAVCDLVNGKRMPLKLGYHIVRNRGGDDEDDEDISKREEMFQSDPWRNLQDNHKGIAVLRTLLRDLLGDITTKAFPKLRADIRNLLTSSRKKYEDLGPARNTERLQQQYLVGVAAKFQGFVRVALSADYSADGRFDDDQLRLITAIINLTKRFNGDFTKSGHAHFFDAEECLEPLATPLSSNVSDGSIEPSAENASKFDGFDDFSGEAFYDLNSIIVTDCETKEPEGQIMAWIEREYYRSRGMELGTVVPSLLSSAFREQSKKWESVTRQYLSQAILIIHNFILRALEHICADSKVRRQLRSALVNELLPKYQEGLKQATLLVGVERDETPYTLNRNFNVNLQVAEGDRITETLRHQARRENNNKTLPLIVELANVAAAVKNKSNTEYTKEKIHDHLKAYYTVASERFVDNVFNQAVHHLLLSGPMSPLFLFSEQWVLRLDDGELNAIAGESRLTQNTRSRLNKEITDLEKAIKIIQ